MKEGIQKWLSDLFERDLTNLKKELDQFEKEADLWRQAEGINNSAGNLALHICGNLQHFVGYVLGNTGYIREREREFNDKDVPKESIKLEIDKTKDTIFTVLTALSDEDLEKTYPLQLWNRSFTTGFFLIHLHSHLNYHLGQINYYRRLL